MKEHLSISKSGEGAQKDVKYVYESGKRRYQFSVFDPFTHKYHFTVFKSKESKNTILAFKNAQGYFKFKIISVQNDNGSEFRGVFHDHLTRRNVPHYFISKKSPYWNGMAERVHRTIDDECYQSPKRIWNTPSEWLDYYNFKRMHLSLNSLTPHEKYMQSATIDC